MREDERKVKGGGMGRVVKWNRKSHMSNVAPEKETSKPGDTKSEKQTTRNAGDVGSMRKQAST